MKRNEGEKMFSLRCKEMGFKKRGYYYCKNINDNVVATILPSIRTCKGVVFFSPNIGICYNDINELYHKLRNFDYEFGHIRGRNLCYLIPENGNYYKEWEVNDENYDIVLSEIFSLINIYGNKYWEEMSNIDNLLSDIDKDYQKSGDGGYFMPIIYYLKGMKEQGLEVIEKTIQKRSRRPTDEELLRGRSPENTILLRAGEGPKLTAEDFEKMLKSLPNGGCIEIVGPGYNGYIDPAYLEFVERYKAL